MARGLPTKQVLIGYSQYGTIGTTKQCWLTSIEDYSLALKNAEELGMKNPKLYPIYKS